MRRGRHDLDEDPPAAEAQRQFVAQHAGRKPDDAEDRGNGGGVVIAAHASAQCRIAEEGNEPGAHRHQFEAMGAIGEDIGKGQAVGEDGLEVQQAMAFARRRRLRRCAEERDQQGDQRPQPQHADGNTPAR